MADRTLTLALLLLSLTACGGGSSNGADAGDDAGDDPGPAGWSVTFAKQPEQRFTG